MLRKLLRAATRSGSSGLTTKNLYRFYNEVPKFDSSKDYYQVLEVNKDSS